MYDDLQILKSRGLQRPSFAITGVLVHFPRVRVGVHFLDSIKVMIQPYLQCFAPATLHRDQSLAHVHRSAQIFVSVHSVQAQSSPFTSPLLPSNLQPSITHGSSNPSGIFLGPFGTAQASASPFFPLPLSTLLKVSIYLTHQDTYAESWAGPRRRRACAAAV